MFTNSIWIHLSSCFILFFRVKMHHVSHVTDAIIKCICWVANGQWATECSFLVTKKKSNLVRRSRAFASLTGIHRNWKLLWMNWFERNRSPFSYSNRIWMHHLLEYSENIIRCVCVIDIHKNKAVISPSSPPSLLLIVRKQKINPFCYFLDCKTLQTLTRETTKQRGQFFSCDFAFWF